MFSPLNTHQSCTNHIVLDLLMYVTTIQHLNNSGPKSQNHKDQGHQTWNDSGDPGEDYSLEDLILVVSKKRLMF